MARIAREATRATELRYWVEAASGDGSGRMRVGSAEHPVALLLEHIVVAVPVASADARDRIAAVADEVLCLETPHWFSAVGQWYRDFAQTSDAEVTELLGRAQR